MLLLPEVVGRAVKMKCQGGKDPKEGVKLQGFDCEAEACTSSS